MGRVMIDRLPNKVKIAILIMRQYSPNASTNMHPALAADTSSYIGLIDHGSFIPIDRSPPGLASWTEWLISNSHQSKNMSGLICLWLLLAWLSWKPLQMSPSKIYKSESIKLKTYWLFSTVMATGIDFLINDQWTNQSCRSLWIMW